MLLVKINRLMRLAHFPIDKAKDSKRIAHTSAVANCALHDKRLLLKCDRATHLT